MFMNIPHWGGEGCQDSPVHSCLCPAGQSGLALLADTGRSVFPWQKCNLFYTHTQNSTQCALSSSTGNEHNAVSVLRHPSLPSRECCARAPAPSSVYHWPGWGLGSHSCSPVLWPLVRALSPRELLKPSSHSNSLSLAIYQPISWPVASGVCFFEMQSL